MTYTDIARHRDEYVAWLKLWIVKQNADVVKWAEHSKKLKKLRHKDVVGEVEWYWTDMIWCQDITVLSCPEEYCLGKFNEEFEFSTDLDDGDPSFLNDCFDEAFRAVMPTNLHSVLEG